MKNRILLYLVMGVIATSLPVSAQDAFYQIFSYDNFIPEVVVNNQTAQLQQSLYPDLYETRSVTGDIRWLGENDSVFVDFWQAQGDTVLHLLTELSGIEWQENNFDIYLVRHFNSLGSAAPLILPLGSISNNQTRIAAPEGPPLRFNFIYQLSKRMLLQINRSKDGRKHPLSYHPLMRTGAYRFDNLAMLLAYSVSMHILDVDTTLATVNSAFWKNNFAGHKIFRKNFETKWILTPERTLIDYLADEPPNSQLVALTRPPRANKKVLGGPDPIYIEGLPLKGMLGFTTRINDKNQLQLDKVDPYRLAYANGLVEGDIIRRVNGRLVKNHKKMVEYILESLNTGGSVLQIIREGKTKDLILQPMDLPLFEEEDQLNIYPDSP